MNSKNASLLEMAEQQADICQIFGNVTRILILWVLGDREMRVGDISEAVGASLQNTSQHLRLMRDRGILASRRNGHAIYYRIDGHRLMQGCAILCRAMEVPLPLDEPVDISTPE